MVGQATTLQISASIREIRVEKAKKSFYHEPHACPELVEWKGTRRFDNN